LVRRIVKSADPLKHLCALARGETFTVAKPGRDGLGVEYEFQTPTLSQRLEALKILAAKILPDLRAVSLPPVESPVMVAINMQAATAPVQKTVEAKADAPKPD
jgi:hypothetical protein